MRIALYCFGICVFVSLAGCGAMKSALYTDYGIGTLSFDKESASMKLKSAMTKTSDSDREHLVDSDCFAVPVDKTKTSTAARCQQQRNAAIVVLLNASDDMCQEHFKTIYGNDAAFNIATGSITNLASGWATITSGVAAKSALSAIAFFSNAERSLVNETVYKNLLVTAVTAKIREARDAKVSAIIPGYLMNDIDTYPMLMAMHDVLGYHYTCSFMFGLEKALKEGVLPSLDSRKAKLEQEKQSLELYLANRTSTLKKGGISATEITGDPGLKGAKDRITAIETELVNLIKVQK